MNNKENNLKHLGKCKKCSENVSVKSLYVAEENEVYHLSCYNYLNKKESI